MYNNYIKRILDFILSLTGFVILLPIFLLITISLAIVNRGQPFCFQVRPEKNEKLFKIIKFKTMNDKKDRQGNLLPDAEHLTKIGTFVRETSLDKTPQLLNVIKGDMSLIGPRPLLSKYLPLYNEEQKKYHNVRSGITGWTQVNGRNAVSWQQKFEDDVWYVKNVSFILDVRILFLMIKKFFFQKESHKMGKQQWKENA